MKHLITVQNQWIVLIPLCDDPALFAASDVEVSNWDVGKQLSHVSMALSRIGKSIARVISKEASNETSPGSETRGSGPNKMGRMILTTGFIPRGRGQAPKYVIPEHSADRMQVLDELNQARAIWTDFVALSNSIQKSKTIIPHHLLGDFTAAHWVRFAGVHTKHHLKIIFDILESNGLSAPRSTEIATSVNH